MDAKKQGHACLLVRVQRSEYSDKPRVFVELGEENAETEADGFPRSPDEVNGLYATDLCLWSHVFEGTGITQGDAEYRSAAFVDIQRAETMLKCLKRVGKRLTALRETQGYPLSWAENVGRFAAATGAKRIAYSVKELRAWLPPDHWIHQDRTYTSKPWIFADVSHARDLLTDIDRAMAARFPAPAREAAQ
jgi:hypothetical protein